MLARVGKRRGEWKLIMICFRGNRNIPKLLVVMVEQYMNIQKKKLHTLNGWVLKCVHIASECKASWKWLAGGLPQSYFPSPEKTDHFPTAGH